MNMVDASIRSEHKIETFKAWLWEWVKSNIAAKPKSRFPALVERRSRPTPTIAAEPVPSTHLITRYFQPLAR